jgi:hypothetical protein
MPDMFRIDAAYLPGGMEKSGNVVAVRGSFLSHRGLSSIFAGQGALGRHSGACRVRRTP